MLMKDECKKVKEREKYQNNLIKLKINYDQTSIEIKKKQMIIFTKKKEIQNLKKECEKKIEIWKLTEKHDERTKKYYLVMTKHIKLKKKM